MHGGRCNARVPFVLTDGTCQCHVGSIHYSYGAVYVMSGTLLSEVSHFFFACNEKLQFAWHKWPQKGLRVSVVVSVVEEFY